MIKFEKYLNPSKMYILIKKNAPDIYKKEINYDLRVKQVPTSLTKIEIDWLDKLHNIRGFYLEVETKFLFNDQFNTAPIERISKTGLRVLAGIVEKVINDQRINKGRCNYCGKTSNLPKCSKGCDSKYFSPFTLKGGFNDDQ
jgi:hypothetical protein